MIEVTKEIFKKIYFPRESDAQKYNGGLVLVIGGGEFFSGSPALSAFAAFRAGADMVRVVAPKRAADIIASFSPVVAAYPLDCKCLDKTHLATLISMVESAKAVSNGKTAVVIGGGVGRSQETQETIVEFLKEVSVPTVIDADAIHALRGKTEVIYNKNFLLTPHTYEFFVLTNREVYRLPQEKKMEIVREESARFDCTILLKGGQDIISNGKEIAVNNAGSPYMAVGGTGDTLAGIAGALLAKGIDPFLAGQGAAFLNGLAGEAAAKKFGESLIVTDVIDEISGFVPKFSKKWKIQEAVLGGKDAGLTKNLK